MVTVQGTDLQGKQEAEACHRIREQLFKDRLVPPFLGGCLASWLHFPYVGRASMQVSRYLRGLQACL